MTSVVLVSVVFLAFVNGANDNFKGVATIYGSGLASYRTALFWATLTTLAGALLAPVIAPGLIGVFKAKGLLPSAVIAQKTFMASAVLAAALAIALATVVGMPVSTTHALVGGMVGAGLVAASGALEVSVLARSFVMPLLAGPFVAGFIGLILGGLAWLVRTRVRERVLIAADDCACIGPELPAAVALSTAAVAAVPVITATVGTAEECDDRYGKGSPRATARGLVDVIHFLSAGAVGFARGVNDAPKIVALGLAAGILAGSGTSGPIALVALAMAAGGVIGARRVAKTMSTRITTIDRTTGVMANSASAALVILGSLNKLPLSTTHVTTGTIVGVGATRQRIDWKVFGQIGLAWVTTLPAAAAIGAATYLILSRTA